MSDLLIFTFIIMLGILVGSFAGFAGSLIAIPLYSIFFTPKDIIPAHSLVLLVVNALLVFESRKHLQWDKIWKLQVFGLLGVPVGAYCLAYLPSGVIRVIISVVTMIFGILFLMKVEIRFNDGNLTQGSIGLLSGFLGGSISEPGPPVVIYGLCRGWPKEVFRTNLLTYFTSLSAMSILSYFFLGMYHRESLRFSLVAVIPAFLAGRIGTRIKNAVSEDSYKKVIIYIILGVAVLGLLKVFY
jgi:hypothetical protein